jgi:hypothetical protein
MTETATQSAGYLGSSSVGSYAALGSSIFGSIGAILDANTNTQRTWDLSYNSALQQATERNRIQQQNNNNSQVAGFNLQQLAVKQAGIENQAGIDYAKNNAAWLNRGQEGSGGVTSATANPGGTGNYLQAAMQLQQVDAEKQQALMRLSQGYQMPTPIKPYKVYTPWDQYLKGVGSSIQGISKVWDERQITSAPNSVTAPVSTLDGTGEG